MKRLLCALALTAAGASAQALELELPANARQMIARDTVQDRYFAPTGVVAEGALPTQMIEGTVRRSAWRIDQEGLTPLQVVAPLRVQLAEAGYRIVLDCAARACGGYDFRFAVEVLPSPNMYVNIRNFHVLSAFQGPEGSEAITVIASASSGVSFVQITQALGEPAETTSSVSEPVIVNTAAAEDQAGNFQDRLETVGRALITGLEFDSGTSQLGAGPFGSLRQLAQLLDHAPDMRLALVGHTDNVGSLEVNMALSRSRAQAVRQRLIDTYGVAANRLEAEGMGYLAPLTTNSTLQGREANRRVEAVLLAE